MLTRDVNNPVKNREDHRHHAVDAIVVALTTRSALQQLSTFHALNYSMEDVVKEKFQQPWKKFREDAAESVANIIVSFKKNGKPQGQLHKESMYGRLYNPDGTERLDAKGVSMFAIRKKVENLSHKEVTQIIDPVVKRIVYDRLEEFGLDTSNLKASNQKKIAESIKSDTLYFIGPKSGKAVPIKSVRVQKPFTGAIQLRDYNVWVETRNNHHIVIYKEIDSGKQKGRVISLIDASKIYNEKLALMAKAAGKKANEFEKELSAAEKALMAVDKELDPGKEYITWLQINDMVLYGEMPENAGFGDKSTYKYFSHLIYKVQKIDQKSTTIEFRIHNTAVLATVDKNGKKIYPGREFKSASVFNGQKIKISPIGLLEYDYD